MEQMPISGELKCAPDVMRSIVKLELPLVFTKHTKLHFAMDLNSTKLTSLETTGRMLPY